MKKLVFAVSLAAAHVGFAKPPHTGIAGQTVIVICPLFSDEVPCVPHPFPATFYVLNGKGRMVETIVTDKDGTFIVSLTPGTYTIVPLNAPDCLHGPCSSPQTVTVEAREFTPVLVGYTIPVH